MLNQYPLWKYLVIVLVMAVGCLYAMPNLFGVDEAIQISERRGGEIDSLTERRVLDKLDALELTPTAIERSPNRLLLRFDGKDSQQSAQEALAHELREERRFVPALNLAPATPGWLRQIGAAPMYMGLDLRGGMHFLIEVDMDAAVGQALERYRSEIRETLREEGVRYRGAVVVPGDKLQVTFADEAERDQGWTEIRRTIEALVSNEIDGQELPVLELTLTEEAARETRTLALQQNITTFRNRVNELGVAEPVIQRQGENRIVVQLPGVQDSARAKDILGAAATLEFRMVDDEHSPLAAVSGRTPPCCKLFYDRARNPILLKRAIMLTGEYIIDATSGIDQQTGSPAVFITLDGRGASIFSKRTRDQIGRAMGVVFIENRTETREVDGKDVRRTITDTEVINVATIRDQLGKRFQITGLDSTQEARNLALLLRAGSLAAPIEIVEERTVGPTLGEENIRQGFRSVVVGLIAVLVFMALYYRVFGLVANVALALNLVLIIAVLSMLQATLTLPGIAGIVLTVGMAVDANVLIFERIREELRNGNTPQSAINQGYRRALSTIADANITTLIAAVLLFAFGTGPVKGFAITLSIGIVTSMFTAIMGTRAIINLVYGGRRVEALSI